MPAPLIRYELDETRMMSRALRASSDLECADIIAVLVDVLHGRLGRHVAPELITHWPRNWIVARQRLAALADHLAGRTDPMLWNGEVLNYALPHWNVGAVLTDAVASSVASAWREQLFFALENVNHFEETELSIRDVIHPGAVVRAERNKRQRNPTIGYGIDVMFRPGDIRQSYWAGPTYLGPEFGTFTYGMTWAPDEMQVLRRISVNRIRKGSALPKLPGWHQDRLWEKSYGWGIYISNDSYSGG